MTVARANRIPAEAGTNNILAILPISGCTGSSGCSVENTTLMPLVTPCSLSWCRSFLARGQVFVLLISASCNWVGSVFLPVPMEEKTFILLW